MPFPIDITRRSFLGQSAFGLRRLALSWLLAATRRAPRAPQPPHDPAHAFMNSGSIQKGRPSMGSWLLYGLGAETDSLPGFIVLTSAGKSGLQPISARQWSSGFLPTRFQGVQFQSKGSAVHYVDS